MRPTLLVVPALLSLSIIGQANAADPILLAQTGGFLLGNAQRCGVPSARVEDARTVIRRAIAAASCDSTQETAAASRFTEVFTASAYPDEEGGAAIPACKVVIAQFQRLERHHQQAGMN
jgi:hypothetical protein